MLDGQIAMDIKATEEDEIIKKVLLDGSGFENGHKRIKDIYKNMGRAERVQAIKKEYGSGGSLGARGLHINYNSKGMEIKYEDFYIKLNWNQVEKEIGILIKNREYGGKKK